MSGFVKAANDAAEAARSLARALTDVNRQLSAFNTSGRDMAQALAPLARASRTVADNATTTAQAQNQLSRSFAQAAQHLNDFNQQQARTSKEAKLTDAQVRSLAKTWLDASDNVNRLNASLTTSARVQGDVANSVATANRQYQQAQDRVSRLTDEQRQSFDIAVEDLRLRRQVSAAVRDTVAQLQLEGRERARTRTQIQALAREYDRLDQLQERLQASSRGVFTRDQAEAMGLFQRRMAQIARETKSFNDAQRSTLNTTLDTLEATRQVTQAKQQAAAAERQATADARQAAQAQAQQQQQLTQLARTYVDTANNLRALNNAQAQGVQLSSQQLAAQQQFANQLNQLRGVYRGLDDDQRQFVRNQRDQILAQQQAAQGAQLAAQAQRQATQVQQQAAQATQQSTSIFDRHSESLFAMRSAIGDLSGILAGFRQTMIQVGTAVARVFSEQEVAIAHLSRVTQETSVFVDNLTASFRRMSTEIPIAFTEFARIGQLGAQVGIANANLEQFTRTVALFTATTEVSADQAAIMFARIAELANVPEDEISNLGAAVSALGSNSAATEEQILRTAVQISTIGRQAQLSERTILGLAAAMASLGIRPELARGALQRTLQEIEQAAQGASDKTEGFAQMMGLSVQEMTALRQEVGREEFLDRFGQAMFRASESGRDLNAVLREIGFANTQDIQVLAALGANWEFVSENINRANTEYAANTFLQREAARLFDTATAAVQTAANAWQNAGAAIGQAFAPAVIFLADLARAAAQLVEQSRALQIALGAIAIAIAGLASLALVAGTIGIITFAIAQLTPALGLMAAAASNAWAALLLFMRGIPLVRVITALGVAFTVLGADMTRNIALAVGALAALRFAVTTLIPAMSRLGAAAAAAVSSMLLFARAHPVIATLTAIGVAVTAVGATLRAMETSADRAQRSLLRANRANFEAAGGFDALQEAIRQDTAAWREHGNEVVLGVRRTRLVTDAMRDSATEAQQSSERINHLTGQLDLMGRASQDTSEALGRMSDQPMVFADLSEGAQDAAQSSGVLARALEDVGDRASTSAFAVGVATASWAAAALEAQLMSSALVESQAAFELVAQTGIDFGAILLVEMQEAGRGVDLLRTAARNLTPEIARMSEGMLKSNAALSGFSRGVDTVVGGLFGWIPAIQEGIDRNTAFNDSLDAFVALEDAADTLQATTLQMELAAAMSSALTETVIDLGNGTQVTAAQIQELGEEGAALAATLGESTLSVGQLAEAFMGVADPVSVLEGLMEDLSSQAQAAGQTFSGLGAEHLPQFVDRMADAQREMVDFASDLLAISTHSGPQAVASLLALGDAGMELSRAMAEALDTGDIDAYQAALDSLQMDAAVQSITDSFARISAATGEELEAALQVWDNFVAALADPDFDPSQMGDLAAQMRQELDAVLGPVEIDIQTAIDESELLANINRHLERIADQIAPVETSIELDTAGFSEAISSVLREFETVHGDADRLATELAVLMIASGNQIAAGFGQSMLELRNQLRENEISAEQFATRLNELFDQIEAEFEIEINRDEVIAQLQETISTSEGMLTTADLTAEIDADGQPALNTAGLTIDQIVAMLTSADPTTTLDADGNPALTTAGTTFDQIIAMATAADPTVTPTTDGAPAEKQASGTYRTIESGAEASKPTVTPTVNSGPAESAASSLWSRLSGILGKTISVPVTPFATGSLSISSFVRRAQGGWVRGPGGPTADRIPTLLSSGEFVIKASQARVWGPFLEAINEGGRPWTDMQRFAAGRTRSEFMTPADTAALRARRTAGVQPLQRTLPAQATALNTPRTVITVNNTYPQAEPTSVTINRALAYQAVLDGVSNT